MIKLTVTEIRIINKAMAYLPHGQLYTISYDKNNYSSVIHFVRNNLKAWTAFEKNN